MAPRLRRALVGPEWEARLESDPSLARERWMLFETGLIGLTKPTQVNPTLGPYIP